MRAKAVHMATTLTEVTQCASVNSSRRTNKTVKICATVLALPKMLGENTKLQFRLEFFNLFNHPMFRYGSSSLDSNVNLHYVGSGGQVVNGVVQGTTLQTGSAFGNTPFSSNLGNREIQYALKFIF